MGAKFSLSSSNKVWQTNHTLTNALSKGPTRYDPSDKRLSKIKYCVSEASNVRQTAHGCYTCLVVSASDRGGYVDEKHFLFEMGRGCMNTSPVFIFMEHSGSCKCTIVLTTSLIVVASWWLFVHNFNKLKPKIPYLSFP